MAFFTEDDKKEIFTFFKWESGKTYKMNIRKGWEPGFAKASGNMLIVKDLETGMTYERKYEFALLEALGTLPEEKFDEDSVLFVTPTKVGERQDKNDSTKSYDVFKFAVSLTEEKASDEEVPFN